MRKKIFTFLLALAASVGMSWATDPIVIATNTGQSSYTQGSITVSVNYVGDSDGFRLNNDNSASISNSGSSTISKIELVPGWFLNKHSYVRANGAEPNSSSEELITFLNVNSNEVTLSCSVSIYIKEVRIYFGEAGGGSTPAGALNGVHLLSMRTETKSSSPKVTYRQQPPTSVLTGRGILLLTNGVLSAMLLLTLPSMETSPFLRMVQWTSLVGVPLLPTMVSMRAGMSTIMPETSLTGAHLWAQNGVR